MPKFRKVFAVWLAAFVSLIPFFSIPQAVIAQITSCDAQVNLTQVDSGSTNNFDIVVTNGSAERIHWLKFTRPSANFTLDSITASGWSTVSADSQSIEVNGNAINTGVSRTFTLNNVVAANLDAPSADWIVQAADNDSGTDPYTCTGTLGTQIGDPDSTPPVISNISVSSITSSSAVVTWTTDEAADSTVNYGLTSGYGSNQTNASFVTSHSVTLSGLSAATAYHYEVVSTDPSTNATSSSDNTFVTAATGSTTTTSTTTTTTASLHSGDAEAPAVTVTTDLTIIYKEAPTISGTATDNVSVASIEYSLDAGENWLPTDHSAGLNTRSATFDFKPLGLSDGNYSVLVRATDPAGNQGVSSEKILIIDVLPPIIGPSSVAFGPLVSRAEKGVIFAVSGVDEKITLQVLGGPISVSIEASTKNQKINKVFTLTKSTDNNLWSGILAFDKAGTYDLVVTAVDGAANKTVRQLNKVVVAESSKVLGKGNVGVADATVTVYYYDQDSSKWTVWDGASFSQTNPQKTDKNGEYNFFLPEGKYYLKITASGYHDLTTSIFEQSEASVLQTTLKMKKALGFKLGSFELKLPGFDLTHPKITNEFKTSEELKIASKDSITDYSFAGLDGNQVTPVDFIGKPTVITFISSWVPNAEDQIRELQTLKDQGEVNVQTIVLLESKEKFAAFQKIAGYNLNFLSDPLGSSVQDFPVTVLPSHLLIGSDGKIKAEVTRFLSKEELLEELSKL